MIGTFAYLGDARDARGVTGYLKHGQIVIFFSLNFHAIMQGTVKECVERLMLICVEVLQGGCHVERSSPPERVVPFRCYNG